MSWGLFDCLCLVSGVLLSLICGLTAFVLVCFAGGFGFGFGGCGWQSVCYLLGLLFVFGLFFCFEIFVGL